MSLNITASIQQQKTKQAYYIPADLGSTQSTHRETFKDQQPVKVKITKKLMERYKNNEEDYFRPQTYRDHFC